MQLVVKIPRNSPKQKSTVLQTGNLLIKRYFHKCFDALVKLEVMQVYHEMCSVHSFVVCLNAHLQERNKLK